MPNINQVLKEEIRRLARKEIKAEAEPARKAAAQQRREIARLKRELAGLERQVRALHNSSRQNGEAEEPEDPELMAVRFSARSVRAQRRRTGLSAEDYGKLLGVSGQTVYLWEKGETRPRTEQLKKLVEIRGIGKKEARKRLEAMGEKSAVRKKK